MKPKISICIPVFNRVDYLAQTLDSILSQSFNYTDIEIVISDNASDDGTKEVATKYAAQYPFIIYTEFKYNKGADLNYMNVVKYASGEYCWLFGSDDIMEKGALKLVLDLIFKTQYDIFLCSEYIGDLQANHISTHYLLSCKMDKQFTFNHVDDMNDFFQLANSQSALFGYLSSIIVNRDRWNEITLDNSYIGTLYSHMYIMYSIIQSGASLYYINEPLVTWRGGNDSFGGKGRITQRYLIDINGFKKIADHFIFKLDTLQSFKLVFRRHHPITNIAYLRMNTPSNLIWYPISRKLLDYYQYNSTMLKILNCSFIIPFLHLVFFTYRVLKWLKRKLR